MELVVQTASCPKGIYNGSGSKGQLYFETEYQHSNANSEPKVYFIPSLHEDNVQSPYLRPYFVFRQMIKP